MAGVGSEKLLQVFEVVFQQILAIFVILILWEVFKDSNFFNLHDWHVALCVLGFGLCMAEGIHIYKQQSIISFGESRESKVKAHLIVMCVAFACVTLGVILKIVDISNEGKPHFNDIHAVLGLVAWIIAFFAGVGGVAATDYFRLPCDLRVWKILHLLVGLTAYVTGIVALAFGINYLHVGLNGTVFLIFILALYVLYSITGPCVTMLDLVR